MKKFILGTLFIFSQKNEAAIQKFEINRIVKNEIIVAVIDTGIDINHDELKKNIWVNKGESGKDFLGNDKSDNGIDDDLNGFIDDIHGWNFIDNNNDISDQIGHGTHVAGIITRTSSAAARLMVLKYYNPEAKDSENIRNSTRAIEYANKMKVTLINYSGGGGLPDEKERSVLENTAKNNIIVIAAAGNTNSNTDFNKYYPANYNLKNIISVAATKKNSELADFSNYGKLTVDLAAPGFKIFSTLPQNKFGYMSGTSQSTAFVTGKIAQLMSETKNDLDKVQILKQFTQSSSFSSSLKDKMKTQLAFISTE